MLDGRESDLLDRGDRSVRAQWRERATGAVMLALAAGGYQLGRARADGIPTAPSMYFGATIDEGGSVVTGSRDITVRLYDAETAGSLLCQTIAPSTMVTAGRLRVALDAACTTAVQQNPNVWSELAVGATTLGRRSKLGAVPYAVEAQRANDLTAAALGRLSNADCPGGYARDTSDSSITPTMRLCVRTVMLGGTAVRDEVVKVGAGSSAFWVDRYEASVHHATSGIQLGSVNGSGGTDGPSIETAGLTTSGQRPVGDGPARAMSHPGRPTVFVSWFQANEACAAAGKRLLTGSEWFRASSGTDDGALCNVSTRSVRPAGAINRCVSESGAHDMIGNVSEWTDEWESSAGQITSAPGAVEARINGIRANGALSPWPSSYNGDGTWNITSIVYNEVEGQTGIPAAVHRGGSAFDGVLAGIFAMNLDLGPSRRLADRGFRCAMPR